jgi:CRISPR-associated protein Csm1
LLQLIQKRDENDRISFARLAYYLARIENEATDKIAFQTFKLSLKEAFEDKEEIRKYEMALMLYLYETRKEG